MKKIAFFTFLLSILILLSCVTDPKTKHSCKAHVQGIVVETYYSDEIIFSTKPVADAYIYYDGEPVAVTNPKGEYYFCLHDFGYYTFIAQKQNYVSESRTQYITGKKTIVDYRLERPDEPNHGWGPFPESTNGPVIDIRGEGLSLYSRYGDQIYATKTITLANNQKYKFSAKLLKDKSTQEVYFGVLPQIRGAEWIYDRCNVNGWHSSYITQGIYDATIIDSVYVQGVGYLYIYPETVEVVLKLGANYGDYPMGHFNMIKVVKE